jgi:transposase
VIDKGLPTAGLLAQVLVAKYQDHLPLYRLERAGIALPRSTLAQWVGACGAALLPLVVALKEAILAHRIVHADETPVKMLDPGAGKTHRAYLWCYSPGAFESVKAVVYDFTESRAAKHAEAFLQGWQGTLLCDDYSGYKPLIAKGLIEAGCMAHARRKFYDLWVHHQSTLAQEALTFYQQLYAVEREVQALDNDERQRIRQEKSLPIAAALQRWLSIHRQKVPDGSAIARAIDYSLKRWSALIRYLHDGALPIDNNHLENQVRPVAIWRSNWLFAGSLRAGQRAAAIMSLINSARLNGLDPYHYLKDVLERLPTHRARDIAELLPHRWQPASA